MGITWLTPSDITPGTKGSWQDADVSGSVPSGATGVILHVYTGSIAAGRAVGFRKNGSTDNRIDDLWGDSHFWVAVGVDSNRVLELYAEDTYVNFSLVGYFGSDASFFTNAVDKSLGSTGSWTDIDISSDTGGDTAIGAIFEVIGVNWPRDYGFRKNGSTDNRVKRHYRHSAAIVGVDGSEICEGNIGNTDMDFFLLGYITADSTFNTNATNLSLGSTGSWTDLSALPSGATGGFIEVITSGEYDFGLRKNGSSEDIYKGPGGQEHAWGMVEADGSRLIEGKIANTNLDFFLVGYSESGVTTEIKTFYGDAFLQKAFTTSFTTDSLLKGTETKTLSADSFLLKTGTTSLAVDSILKGAQATSFSVDSLLMLGRIASFSADSFLRASFVQSFSVDALLYVQQASSFSVDSVLLENVLKSFSADALLLGGFTTTFSVDSVLIGGSVTKDFVVDALLLGAGSNTFVVDSLLFAGQSLPFVVDSFLSKAFSHALAVDSLLVNEGILKTLSVDSVLLVVQTSSVSVDSILVNVRTNSLIVDSLLLSSQSSSFSVDSLLRSVHLDSFTVDSILIKSLSASFSADSCLQASLTHGFSVDSFLVIGGLETLSVDSILVRSGLQSFSADSFLKSSGLKSFSVDACLFGSVTLGFIADALLSISASSSFSVGVILADTIDYIDSVVEAKPFVYSEEVDSSIFAEVPLPDSMTQR